MRATNSVTGRFVWIERGQGVWQSTSFRTSPINSVEIAAAQQYIRDRKQLGKVLVVD